MNTLASNLPRVAALVALAVGLAAGYLYPHPEHPYKHNFILVMGPEYKSVDMKTFDEFRSSCTSAPRTAVYDDDRTVNEICNL